MDFEGIGTLVLLWIFWTVFERIKDALEKRKGEPEPYPVESEIPGEMEFRPEFQPVIKKVARKVSGAPPPPAMTGEVPVAVAPQARSGAAARRFRRERLREAVIWSEILAPPVALRRETDSHQ